MLPVRIKPFVTRQVVNGVDIREVLTQRSIFAQTSVISSGRGGFGSGVPTSSSSFLSLRPVSTVPSASVYFAVLKRFPTGTIP